MEEKNPNNFEDEDPKNRQRKTTICCLTEDRLKSCNSKKWIYFRFVALFFIFLLVLCIIYGLKDNMVSKEGDDLKKFYAVGDPVYARDLWLVVELASDDRGRRTREGKESAAHVCSAIRAAQIIGWTPLVVGARSPCCRTSRCRHLHPTDLERLNYTLSGYFEREGQTRMALKTAGFLAAIERGARFIFQANPEIYYRANVSPKQYQSELIRQLRKTTIGITAGMVKTFKDDVNVKFDPYGHFGQTFQNTELENNINQYKICQVKPPSLEKFLDSDGSSLDLSAPPFTIPGGKVSSFDTRNAAFSKEAFAALFLMPENDIVEEKDQYYIRSLFANALLQLSAGSSKFSVAEVATTDSNEIVNKSEMIENFQKFFNNWECSEHTILRCMRELGGRLLESQLITKKQVELMDMWVDDLIAIGYEDTPKVPESLAALEPCIGQESLTGVYFHPSVRPIEVKQRSRDGKSIAGFETKLKKSQQFASTMIQRLCPAVDLDKALTNFNNYEPHDGLLLIVTFYKKDYHNIPLFEIMYRHHFKNIIYCGEPDPLVDEYMERYNGDSGTYFSFLPVIHNESAGYECLLGAIELGYNVDGYLLVNEDTLINSWNFNNGAHLNPKTIWHGNEHAVTISATNLNEFPTEPKNIMKSMLGILHAFQFLEQILLSNQHPSFDDLELEAPPLPQNKDNNGHVKRSAPENHEDFEDLEHSHEHEDYSDEEMTMSSEMDDIHDMSIIDAPSNQTEKEGHINFFGEIVHDYPEDDMEESAPVQDSVHASKNLLKTELLFHPANFMKDYSEDENVDEDMEKEHFSEMMLNIKTIYQRINHKLNLWTRFKKLRMRFMSSSHEEESENNHEMETMAKEMKKMANELKDLNCNNAANAEVCHLVANFFEILAHNEGDQMKLVYDDLPIYYVPEGVKDRLFLMANLFTKFHVADELAFPLLLRGLDKTEDWTILTRADLSEEEQHNVPKISRPQDLFSEALDDKIEKLENIESAHYIYPVEVKSVLTNQDLKTVVCRNF